MHRDMTAAGPFFEKLKREHCAPTKIEIDKSGANKAAVDEINSSTVPPTAVRQVKYLNNIVDLDHRAIKRVTVSMLGFKSFCALATMLAGIELMHIIRKGQFVINGADSMSFADQFYVLAQQVRPT